MNDSALSLWVIYWNPSDAPHQYVLREWRVLAGGGVQPSVHKVTEESKERLHAHLPSNVHNLGRCSADDPAICEVWI